MAHLAKFTKAACGHMFKHYERAKEFNSETGQVEYIKFANQEINPQRTHLNYNLAVHQTMRQGDFIRKRCSEVKLQNRKDVNVMCSWVLTAPKNLPSSEQKSFFKASYDFMANRYGEENVISAYVHLDETTPHIHFAFIPITADKKKGGYKVSAKEVINKRELQVFHQDLDKYLETALGHSVGVLNGNTKDGNKSISELKEKSALERIEELQIEAVIAQKRLDELNGQILSAEELKAIEGKKSIGGALKNVSWEEWQSVKATAEQAVAENEKLKEENELLSSENKDLKKKNASLSYSLNNPLSNHNIVRSKEKTDKQNQINLLKSVLSLDTQHESNYDELRRELIQRGYIQTNSQRRKR
ncbi:MAG: plasmid recombination protein [Oscillospiraceae bacterium]|nr:plasmid recombination protein [Oscillospiraceae bacterium]